MGTALELVVLEPPLQAAIESMRERLRVENVRMMSSQQATSVPNWTGASGVRNSYERVRISDTSACLAIDPPAAFVA